MLSTLALRETVLHLSAIYFAQQFDSKKFSLEELGLFETTMHFSHAATVVRVNGITFGTFSQQNSGELGLTGQNNCQMFPDKHASAYYWTKQDVVPIEYLVFPSCLFILLFCD